MHQLTHSSIRHGVFVRITRVRTVPASLRPLWAWLIERRAIEDVMGHEHESSPHDVCSSHPKMIWIISSVFIAGLVVERSFIPKHDVGIGNRGIRGNIGWKKLGSELARIVGRHPKLILREVFVMLSQASSGN